MNVSKCRGTPESGATGQQRTLILDIPGPENDKMETIGVRGVPEAEPRGIKGALVGTFRSPHWKFVARCICVNNIPIVLIGPTCRDRVPRDGDVDLGSFLARVTLLANEDPETNKPCNTILNLFVYISSFYPAPSTCFARIYIVLRSQ